MAQQSTHHNSESINTKTSNNADHVLTALLSNERFLTETAAAASAERGGNSDDAAVQQAADVRKVIDTFMHDYDSKKKFVSSFLSE
jgi:hypothetical protein